MKVGIDISQIAHAGTGVARYTHVLIQTLLQYGLDDHEYIFFYSSLRKPIDKKLAKTTKNKAKLIIKHLPPTLLDILWNRLHILPVENFVGNVDVFISSDWTQPPVESARSVTIVHDLVYKKYPDTPHPTIKTVLKRRMKWVKKEIETIIADSKATKHDLIHELHIPANKIKVVYPAVEVEKPEKKQLESTRAKYHLTKKFILSVAKQEPRKNIQRLIEAYQKTNIKNTELLIVGPEGWGNPSFNTNDKMSNVRFLGFVPDEDLYSLYSQALFFIYPSLYEGFGYPVVEAMALGCPVTTSNTSSLAEIAKGYGLLFNPESEQEITNAIIKLHSDKKLRDELSKKGKERVKNFSAEKFAKQLLEVL